MSDAVRARLHAFVTTVLERRGALVDWPDDSAGGLAVLTPELAGQLNAPETLRLSSDAMAVAGGLNANLGTDFLERIQPLVRCEPQRAAAAVPALYLKRGGVGELVARTFTWLNARVKVKEAREIRVPYHRWAIRAALHSDDAWEDVLVFSLNTRTGAAVELPDPASVDGLRPDPEGAQAALNEKEAFEPVWRQAALLAQERAAPFVARMEARWKRDRQRVRDYYKALENESTAKAGRARAGEPNAETGSRAVELELRRKLGELDERYAIRAELEPLARLTVDLPVLEVHCEVFRKQSQKERLLYWNPLLTALEPLACGGCGKSIFAVHFTDAAVEPRCAACAAAR
jgi:hypothetical protein